jgi:hypothetical protein
VRAIAAVKQVVLTNNVRDIGVPGHQPKRIKAFDFSSAERLIRAKPPKGSKKGFLSGISLRRGDEATEAVGASALISLNPMKCRRLIVTSPPGWFGEDTSPAATASPTQRKTIGMSLVPRFAAIVAASYAECPHWEAGAVDIWYRLFQNAVDRFVAVGLYLSPPNRALVLSIDEKSQIQALDREQPVLPMMPGVPERRTHSYVRHGTTSLFAALDVASGFVIGKCYKRHRVSRVLEVLKRDWCSSSGRPRCPYRHG